MGTNAWVKMLLPMGTLSRLGPSYYTCTTDVARSTMGLVWIKKIWAETSTSQRLYHYFYFKTIGYCSRTKVNSSLILRRFYATWPWPLTLGLKCYYLWELYHAWVLVITFVLSTDVARSTMGLVWIKKKSGRKLKPVKYTSSYSKVLTFV